MPNVRNLKLLLAGVALMASAATAFLASLTPEQRAQATFQFGSDERTRWNFIPPQAFPRKGLTFRAMS